MKRCSKCRLTKPFSDFNRNARKVNGVQTYCRGCQAENDRQYYAARDKTKKLAKAREWRRGIREWVTAYKQTLHCLQCGNSDFRVLEFHHRGGKRFNVGDALHRGFGLGAVKEEIEKCDCLCANCHRIVTYEQRTRIS